MTAQPPFVWTNFGSEALIYATWSVRSLARFGWPRIHVMAMEQGEVDLLRRRLEGWIDPGVTELTFEVVPYPLLDSWGATFFKLYTLVHSDFVRENPSFVYCDADILIHQDPRVVLDGTGGELWFHKLDWNKALVYREGIESFEGKQPYTREWALAALVERFGPVDLRWTVNGGFFQLPADRGREILDTWDQYAFTLPRSAHGGDQEVLSVGLHHLGLEPLCDKPANYAMARHYLADLKLAMVRDAVAAGLDPDRLRLALYRRWAPGMARRSLGHAGAAARALLRRR